jgi:hypothetical protein
MPSIPPEIAAAWELIPERAEPLGRGRINRTLLVPRRAGGALVLQCLNGLVFPRPERVMENLRRVLDHLPSGPLRLVPSRSGEDGQRDAEGHLWRAWVPIENARTVEGRATPTEAHACASAFGAFLHGLVDLPPDALHVTLPGFHDTRARLAAFEGAAVAAAPELDADRERIARLAPMASALEDLPIRIAHFDTKLNNVLLRADHDEALAVLDLDTVQPGSWAVDFGDMARSACNPVGEDPDPSEIVAPDLATFEALSHGFLMQVRDHLTPEERERMAVAPAVLAFELGLRFLTDHLQGDRIFRAERPGQNLDRARVQLLLAEGFLKTEGALRRCISVT